MDTCLPMDVVNVIIENMYKWVYGVGITSLVEGGHIVKYS